MGFGFYLNWFAIIILFVTFFDNFDAGERGGAAGCAQLLKSRDSLMSIFLHGKSLSAYFRKSFAQLFGKLLNSTSELRFFRFFGLRFGLGKFEIGKN